MIFDSENINVNCQRYLIYCYVLFSYICNECIKAVHSNSKIPFHLLVYSGGWFFYCHGADLCRLLVRNIRLRKPSVAFLWFRVSEGGHRYAHKTPVLAEFQDKNGTPENPPQCMQCPEPDNMRPCKAIFCFIGGYPVGNSGLSLGRLVHCTGKMPVCGCPGVLQGGRGYIKKRNYEQSMCKKSHLFYKSTVRCRYLSFTNKGANRNI